MKNKNCPWCERKLSVSQLLLLDDHSPTVCKSCGKFVRNASVNLIVPIALPVVLCFIAYYIIGLELIFALGFLILIPILRLFFAEPIKYSK